MRCVVDMYEESSIILRSVKSKVYGEKKTLMLRPKRVDPEAPKTTRY